ncbi:DUF2325 domain-containing protein [Reyranella sp.]|uniref:DUF2325 domain-containing protein n=1 Tax=Reyranella sp. TaxID=1929291 RepID=UPI003784C5D4
MDKFALLLGNSGLVASEMPGAEAAAAALLCPSGSEEDATPGRYKIWELESGTHCSVIGTCLSLEDLHRLIRKANATIAPDADDHDIHGYFVIQAARRSVVSKLIHKALDRKYAPQIAHFRSGTPDELWALWRQAMTNGDVAGTYWALMTQKAVPRPMRIRAYNEIHMLSHLMGKSSRDDIKRIRQLEAAHAEIARKLEQTRARADADVQERDARIRTLEAQLAAVSTVPREVPAPPTMEGRKLEAQIDRLQARFSTLERRVKVERARARGAERQLSLIAPDRHRRLSGSPPLPPPATSEGLAPVADGQADESLVGRAVLYVGGYRDVTPRLRAHVEEKGGTFLYHDGGIEMQTTRLSGLVSQASTVLCPVGCVSHDACIHLKRLCKRHSKRLILLRSAGLSGFVSALSEIGNALPIAGAAAAGALMTMTAGEPGDGD